MNQTLSLNFGQHILYGYICTAIQGEQEMELTFPNLENIITQVIEITHHSNYERVEECPDVQIMIHPENSYKIFCDFWDENQEYFLAVLN